MTGPDPARLRGVIVIIVLDVIADDRPFLVPDGDVSVTPQIAATVVAFNALRDVLRGWLKRSGASRPDEWTAELVMSVGQQKAEAAALTMESARGVERRKS